jgi:hypothetical protein
MKQKQKFYFYSDGETIWFYGGRTWKSKKYTVPNEIVQQIVHATGKKVRQEIRQKLGILE